jgi:hypothetical protein
MTNTEIDDTESNATEMPPNEADATSRHEVMQAALQTAARLIVEGSRAVSAVSEASGLPARLSAIEPIECELWREDLSPIETGIAPDAKPIYIALRGKTHRTLARMEVPSYTQDVRIIPPPEGETGMIVQLVPTMTTAKHILKNIKGSDQVFGDGLTGERPVFLFPPKWNTVAATRADQKIGVEATVLHFSQDTYQNVASYEAPGTYPLFVVTKPEFFGSAEESVKLSDAPPLPYHGEDEDMPRHAVMAMTWETFKSKAAVMPIATLPAVDRAEGSGGKKRSREEEECDADGCDQPDAKRAVN